MSSGITVTILKKGVWKMTFKTTKFRKELIKVMPGYKWTIHRSYDSKCFIEATGIMSSGFNRMSTLRIAKTKKGDRIEYAVKGAGFGLRAPWLFEYIDSTLPRALRSLQNHYSQMADNYSRHAGDLECGRVKKKEE